VVAIYNDRPQSGRLNGLPPLAMLERKIKETGFIARVPDEESFDIIFSRQDVLTIVQGCINVKGIQYRAPFLDNLPDRDTVEIVARQPPCPRATTILAVFEAAGVGVSFAISG